MVGVPAASDKATNLRSIVLPLWRPRGRWTGVLIPKLLPAHATGPPLTAKPVAESRDADLAMEAEITAGLAAVVAGQRIRPMSRDRKEVGCSIGELLDLELMRSGLGATRGQIVLIWLNLR